MIGDGLTCSQYENIVTSMLVVQLRKGQLEMSEYITSKY